MRLSYIAYCKDTTLGESRRHIAGYPRQKIATKQCKMVQASLYQNNILLVHCTIIMDLWAKKKSLLYYSCRGYTVGDVRASAIFVSPRLRCYRPCSPTGRQRVLGSLQKALLSIWRGRRFVAISIDSLFVLIRFTLKIRDILEHLKSRFLSLFYRWQRHCI